MSSIAPRKALFLGLFIITIVCLSSISFAYQSDNNPLSSFFLWLSNVFSSKNKITGYSVSDCESISGVNPAVPADACCVVNGVYLDGGCEVYAYTKCVAKYALKNLQGKEVGQSIYYAARSSVSVPADCTV